MKVYPSELWRLLGYYANRNRDAFSKMPMSVTVSVTNRCNSRCRTCYIWNLYQEKPLLESSELKLWEFDRIFESLGRNVRYLVISGGEPFLRKDLPEICASAYEHCRPNVITIPTNALLPRVIEDKLKQILDLCADTNFTVNLSLDGVGYLHDEIRGVKGNFQSFLDTYNSLAVIKKDFPNLIVGVHSVLSNLNLDDLIETYKFVRQLNPDSYIVEVAEERTELFNQGSHVTPAANELGTIMQSLRANIKRDYLHRGSLVVRLIQASRLAYYDAIPKILGNKRRTQPCYAGSASCQITAYGDVWPCCVLGYNQPMGNLRECNYDFGKVWFSAKADEIRRYIRDGNCSCPLANAWYTSAFSSPRQAIKIMATLASSYF